MPKVEICLNDAKALMPNKLTKMVFVQFLKDLVKFSTKTKNFQNFCLF